VAARGGEEERAWELGVMALSLSLTRGHVHAQIRGEAETRGDEMRGEETRGEERRGEETRRDETR
jgi:hypothetical protein